MKKKSFLSRISDFSRYIDSMLEALYSNNISLVKVTSSIKQCNLMNSGILFPITKSQTIEANTTYQTTIFHKLQEINSMMTDYPANPPIAARQTEPVQVSNNNYQYTDSRIIEVELLLGGIKDELSKYSLFVIQS